MVKNLKRSIRDKYKRRERNLYHALEQFLLYAEDRLDESIAGKIKNREKTEQLVFLCAKLLEEIPEPKENMIDPNLDIVDMLDIAEKNTRRISKEAQEWEYSLSDEELELILNSHEEE